MTKECWSIFKKKVEVKVETQQCSWIGDKSERHHLNIIPSRPYLDRFFRIVKSVQTERGSINYILHVMADGWRILIHVSTLNIYKYLWSRRYGSSSCVELSNSVKRNCIFRNKGVRFYEAFVSLVEYDGRNIKKNLYFRLHGSKYPDCPYFLSSLLPLTLSCEIR